MSTYPNPLDINFGEGRIIICKWDDKEARGVVFLQTDKKYPIGATIDTPEVLNHTPEEGEIYLRFKNVESCKVLHGILGEVIADFDRPSPRREEDDSD